VGYENNASSPNPIKFGDNIREIVPNIGESDTNIGQIDSNIGEIVSNVGDGRQQRS